MSKVKVRIAVAVNENGDWSSCGWRGMEDAEGMGNALDGLGAGTFEQVHWVEAEVDLPLAPVIQGTVKAA